MTDAVDRPAVEAFLYREARLLDEQRFEDWLALFDEDGLYWIPGLPGQTDRFGAVSIVHEDRTVLRMRVRRISHPRAWSLMPLPRSLAEASERLAASAAARACFSDAFIDHFVASRRREVEAVERHVSAFERARYIDVV